MRRSSRPPRPAGAGTPGRAARLSSWAGGTSPSSATGSCPDASQPAGSIAANRSRVSACQDQRRFRVSSRSGASDSGRAARTVKRRMALTGSDLNLIMNQQVVCREPDAQITAAAQDLGASRAPASQRQPTRTYPVSGGHAAERPRRAGARPGGAAASATRVAGRRCGASPPESSGGARPGGASSPAGRASPESGRHPRPGRLRSLVRPAAPPGTRKNSAALTGRPPSHAGRPTG